MNNNFSLISLFIGNDLMIQFISFVLLIASIICWAIIFEKLRLFRLEKNNPIKITLKAQGVEFLPDRLIKKFDKNLWFLLMVSYVAPFIGLFGTIWGVMQTFSSIGINQSVSLAFIAPGLAGALGTTALGLIAAIPASIAHQYFSKKADDLYERLDEESKIILKAMNNKVKNAK